LRLLLDTHILLLAAGAPERLPEHGRRMLDDPSAELIFSAASIWEISIKRGLNRDDFQVDPRALRRGLLNNGYIEMPITGAHALALDVLPPIHKDPFDRMLIAQSIVENTTLVTVDPIVARYPGPISRI
jgi:PIN domain nuclease of toxin-antitoxin system